MPKKKYRLIVQPNSARENYGIYFDNKSFPKIYLFDDVYSGLEYFFDDKDDILYYLLYRKIDFAIIKIVAIEEQI